MRCRAADGEGANAGTGASQTRYQSISSVLCWEMINTVLRVWLNEADTSGKQKQASDWDLQEGSIKVLRCGTPAAPRTRGNKTCARV